MKKRILYIINVDWFFVSHFLPVGMEAIKRGYEVHIACAVTQQQKLLENLGFVVHMLSLSRKGMNIIKEFETIREVYCIIKLVKPDILECFTVKPILYGGIIARFFAVQQRVFYVTGLGYAFIAKGVKGVITRAIIKNMYKLAIASQRSLVITENKFDTELINSLNVLDNRQIKIIKGAGVDLTQYVYKNENDNQITIVMACRLLKDKGVFEYIEAAKILKDKDICVAFELYGDIDTQNPSSLTEDDLKKIKSEGYVAVRGFCHDIASLFSKSNIVVLPSYREGLPKVLIEAAACGRAVVTTDVPGCRDAIIPDVTGLLCEVKNARDLAKKIEVLILNKQKRNDLGKKGRELAEREFDIRKIVQDHCALYEIDE